MIDSFVVHKDWLNSILELPIEQQDKIIADVVRYGVGLDIEHSNDIVVQSFVNLLKGRIDFSKMKYEEKVVMSQNAGRKKTFDDMVIYQMARQGLPAQRIAEELGCSKSTIDKSPGWKNRKNSEYKPI